MVKCLERFLGKAAKRPEPIRSHQRLWDKKRLLHKERIDQALKHGIISCSWTFHGLVLLKICKIEFCDGKTKKDLIEFFSGLDSRPTWDAFVAAEAKGIVKIINPGN